MIDERENILKDYFSGKSFKTLVKEYQDKHTAISEKTGKEIKMPKQDAEAVIGDVLAHINWKE